MNRNVVIVDYGRGNLFSVSRAVSEAGGNPVIVDTPAEIAEADFLILPGVGAFGDAMLRLHERNLVEPILRFIETGRPYLGICLGMQMLLDESHEFGTHRGLGVIPGKVERIPQNAETGLPKIPSVGWCGTGFSGAVEEIPALRQFEQGTFFYFVHSFQAVVTSDDHLLGWYELDGQKVSAIIRQDNVLGCQFHPEKSGENGIALIRSWLS